MARFTFERGILRTGTAFTALVLLGAGLAAAPAFAQNPGTPTPPPPAPGTISNGPNQPATIDAATSEAQEGGEAIIVTGSLIRRTDTETPSPVTILSAETLADRGITNINDAVRSISADSAGSISTGFQNGFSAGGAAVSLRGLGVSSTLVLIDGLRSVNFPLNDDGHNAYVDLNSIPFSAVDRVEVLKDGASSTYGADAIGGVVNVILKKHFTGIEGTVEGGISQRGDAGRERANLTAGWGDYDDKGFNVYVNAEYQHDGAVRSHSRGFPYNTNDLSSIGGLDNNAADGALTTGTTTAVVTRVHQNDLNNPLSGQLGAPLTNQYFALNLNCEDGTFTQATAATQGTSCRHNPVDDFNYIQPQQERYSADGRLSFRISDDIEAYLGGSYSHNEVITRAQPQQIRQRQPFGAAPSTASNNPGIVLPVYICSAGVNCTAANGTLNPNNPFAAAFAGDPANGAARIYYQFGDIPFFAERNNEVFRVNPGIIGSFGDDWNFRVEGVYAKDRLRLDQHGYLSVAGLANAINTGSYNFVDPTANSEAVRDAISPIRTTRSNSTLKSLDASLSHSFFDLPGGPLQVVIGGQIRRETLLNRNQNADLAYYNLTTSNAQGKHTVSAAFFEIDAPVIDSLDLNVSGRYDHYSEGFSHFSPKFQAKFTPIKELAIRGTYSKGFRAPTFAEANPNSSFAGFVTLTPPCSFVLAHGGTGNATTCSTNGNPYSQAYSSGGAFVGNPDLKPEKSRSFTLGLIAQPVRWFSLTVDYYDVKKSDLIVAGPDLGAARTAYFAGQPLPAGYTVNTVDAPDPLFPNALPRVLIINAPYVNGPSVKTSGLDVTATATVPFGDDAKFISRIEVTDIFKYNFNNSGSILKYVGTLGPYELSSGAGTPKWRGNWQNTLEVGPYSLTATAYYVSHIKEVAADEIAPDADGNIDLSCANNLYGTDDAFCHIKRFINVDLNGSVRVNDNFTFFVNVENAFDAHAPVAPASYSGLVNFLPTWHFAGIIGRTFRAGASFKF